MPSTYFICNMYPDLYSTLAGDRRNTACYTRKSSSIIQRITEDGGHQSRYAGAFYIIYIYVRHWAVIDLEGLDVG